MLPTIDWSILTECLERYEGFGFKRVELPWVVDQEIVAATCGDYTKIFDLASERWGRDPTVSLIGSAEQSFLAEAKAGRLPEGRYCALTPCFRKEPVLDKNHQTQFMKIELFSNNIDLAGEVEFIRGCAMSVMSAMVQKTAYTKYIVLPSPAWHSSFNGRYDLNLNGVEIGSYGIRSVGDVFWAYGTGLAEPRFSSQINELMKQINL